MKLMDAVLFTFGFKGWDADIRQQTEAAWANLKTKIAETLDAILIPLGLPTAAEFKDAIDASWQVFKRGMEDFLSLTLGLHVDFDALKQEIIEWWNSGWIAQNFPFLQAVQQQPEYTEQQIASGALGYGALTSLQPLDK